jgi:16S rRNA (adenine1518-N6/adenine1519-N6)-dimethyltransferase
MKKFLNDESQHKARKRFGQNFLIDHGIIRDIVRSVHPKKDDLIVEIGPGKGAITQLLADSCDNLSVIELDRDLVPWLKVKFEQHPNFQLFQADALQFDFAQLIKNALQHIYTADFSSAHLCEPRARHAFYVAERGGQTYGRATGR